MDPDPALALGAVLRELPPERQAAILGAILAELPKAIRRAVMALVGAADDKGGVP